MDFVLLKSRDITLQLPSKKSLWILPETVSKHRFDDVIVGYSGMLGLLFL